MTDWDVLYADQCKTLKEAIQGFLEKEGYPGKQIHVRVCVQGAMDCESAYPILFVCHLERSDPPLDVEVEFETENEEENPVRLHQLMQRKRELARELGEMLNLYEQRVREKLGVKQ